MKRTKTLGAMLCLAAAVVLGAGVTHACDDDVKKEKKKQQKPDAVEQWFYTTNDGKNLIANTQQWVQGYYATPLMVNDGFSYFVAPGDDKLAAQFPTTSYWFADDVAGFDRKVQWQQSPRFSVKYDDTGNFAVFHDGATLPDDRVERKGNQWVVKGADGKQLGGFIVKPDGGVLPQAGWELSFSPTITTNTQANDNTIIIGVNLGTVGDALASHLGLEAEHAVIITDVIDGYPAKAAGLQKHDVITAINGASPASSAKLREVLKGKDPGYHVTLTIVRGGQARVVSVGTARRKNTLTWNQPQAFTPQGVWNPTIQWDTKVNPPKGGRIYSPRINAPKWKLPDAAQDVLPDAVGTELPGAAGGTIEERLERVEKLLKKLLEEKKK